MLGVLAAATAISLGAGRAQAATINVTTVNMADANGDGCSLPEAVRALNNRAAYFDCIAGNGSSDAIVLKAGIGTYNIPFELVFTRSVILRSATSGTKVVLVSDSGDPEALFAHNGANFEVRDIDLRSGPRFHVGIFLSGTSSQKLTIVRSRITGFRDLGVWANGTDLEIVDSTIANNQTGVAHFGDNGATLTIRHSEISNNGTTSNGGGGLHAAAGGKGSIVNSTIGLNGARNNGGGIRLASTNSAMTFDIIASTIAHNTAGGSGGGVFMEGSCKTNVNATIIANNQGVSGTDWYGTITQLNNSLLATRANNSVGSGSNNLFEAITFRKDDITMDGGGTTGTKVMIPIDGSRTIDFLTTWPLPAPADDQRHFPRPAGANFDVGAVEHYPHLETELLVVADKTAGVTHTVENFGEFLNGSGTNLRSNAVGQYVTYRTPSFLDSCADIVLGVRRTSSSAQIKVEYSTSNNPVWKVLNPKLDLWARTPTRRALEVVLNFKVILDTTFFRFTVVGKNNANTDPAGYQMFLDYIKITRNPIDNCPF